MAIADWAPCISAAVRCTTIGRKGSRNLCAHCVFRRTVRDIHQARYLRLKEWIVEGIPCAKKKGSIKPPLPVPKKWIYYVSNPTTATLHVAIRTSQTAAKIRIIFK